MRAAVWTGPDRIDVREVPVPDVPPGWVLLRTELTGLCGTDFAILHGRHPRAVAPQILGHEITGVVERGPADGSEPGTRVTAVPLISCGRCRPCGTGTPHVCRDLMLYGIDRPGSLAEFVALPSEVVVPFRPGISARAAALAEPLAVAVHAVGLSGLAGGERVLVFGAGPIGVLTALVARHAGAHVWICDPSPARAELARVLGLGTVRSGPAGVADVLALTDGAGADIVFDSAGHPAVAALLSAVSAVRGTIVLVGVYKEPAAVDLRAITFGEQRMLGVRVYTRDDVRRAVELIETDALGLGRLPVAVFDLAETAAAFELAMAAGPTLKVLVSSDPALVDRESDAAPS